MAGSGVGALIDVVRHLVIWLSGRTVFKRAEIDSLGGHAANA